VALSAAAFQDDGVVPARDFGPRRCDLEVSGFAESAGLR
jgi:hypothetical protein